MEGEGVIGVDADAGSRPGVPMAAVQPTVRPPRELVDQTHRPKPLHRAGLDRPTPVYGTAQPPHGFSGVIRKMAYAIPEHFARHWMLLLLADRVDVVEDRAGAVAARPLEKTGMTGPARLVRQNALPLLAGLAVSAWGLRALRR